MSLPNKPSGTEPEILQEYDTWKDEQSRVSFLETRLDGCLKTIEEHGMRLQLLEELLEEPTMEEEF